MRFGILLLTLHRKTILGRMENPFKFGSVVEERFFTDRVDEVKYISQFIESSNHLIVISPRRFGKSSVVLRAVKSSNRPYIMLNLQNVTSVTMLAARLLKEIYNINPVQRIRDQIVNFRIIPTITQNPVSGLFDVEFHPSANANAVLEDVMELADRLYSDEKRLVIVLDEFQEIIDIESKLDRKLRSIMQMQKHINYIMLGSQESMMSDIFEKKKSPFYHFGEMMRLSKIPRGDFEEYIATRMKQCLPGSYQRVTSEILDFTDCHPYYTQQLASMVWQNAMLQSATDDIVKLSIDHIVETHDLDYERLWLNFRRMEKWLLLRLASHATLNTSEYPTSTIYSALKRLQKTGYVNYTTRYEIEDPFFKQYVISCMG